VPTTGLPMTKDELIALARRIAAEYQMDASLVCAVVEQESDWNPWAMRYEPGFYERYIASLYTNNKVTATEATARAVSWGLMQVMGQTAREIGVNSLFLSALCEPEAGLRAGCSLLRRKLYCSHGDITRALLAWNGGGNAAYPSQVQARMAKYIVASDQRPATSENDQQPSATLSRPIAAEF
jgi:soluble lytic murein transglycosylase-like protein